jgi:hypothetical protein
MNKPLFGIGTFHKFVDKIKLKYANLNEYEHAFVAKANGQMFYEESISRREILFVTKATRCQIKSVGLS